MKDFWRWLMLVVLASVALQVFFLARIALMLVINPESTTFERSEAWRVYTSTPQAGWRQEWVPYERISDNLKRAVIASEDGDFVNHNGVEWNAIEKAWQKNSKAAEQATRRAQQLRPGKPAPVAKIIGGSTITQQLAKNLFLSGERNFLRKGQEFVITFMLEALLGKERILGIYLNNVEWGEGIFGAQAASRHYFHVDAAQLGVTPAARLAVMLPAPKRFEKNPGSAYVTGRGATIAARLGGVELP